MDIFILNGLNWSESSFVREAGTPTVLGHQHLACSHPVDVVLASHWLASIALRSGDPSQSKFAGDELS